MKVEIADWQRDMTELRAIRDKVFIVEQNVPKQLEHDDADETATHFIARLPDGRAIGTGRLLPSGQIGRMAVLAEYRGRGVGARILAAAVAAGREAGHYRLFLHAQRPAFEFYVRHGFEPEGRPFMEAGIEHIEMSRTFPIEFRATGRKNLKIVKSEDGPEYAGAAGATQDLASQSDAVIALDSPSGVRAALIDLLRFARSEVLIYSQELDPFLFDDEEVEAQLSRLARQHPRNKCAILIFDSKRARESTHRLLALQRRLSSKIGIRLVHEEMRDPDHTWVTVDRRGILMLPKFTEYSGFVCYNHAVHVLQRREEFAYLWSRGSPDPYLRQLG